MLEVAVISALLALLAILRELKRILATIKALRLTVEVPIFDYDPDGEPIEQDLKRTDNVVEFKRRHK